MAKFTSHVFSEIRGSIAGTVFSRNRYGAYTRNRVKPTVSTTERATLAKAYMTQASQAWQDLTAARRISWTEWARGNPFSDNLGMSQVLSGHAAFVGLCSRALHYGAAEPTDPPTSPAPAPFTTCTITPDKTGGTCLMAFTPALGADCILWFPCCQVASIGKSYVKNLLKGNCSSKPDAPATPYDCITAIEARIGSLIIGYELHVMASVMNVTTFLQSAPTRLQETVV